MFVTKLLLPYGINLNLKLLYQHPTEILYFQNLAIIYGGFLLAFGFSLGKAFVMTGFLVDYIFVNQVLFFKSAEDWQDLSMRLGLLGGVLIL
jgi:hypothetical protein